MRSFSVFTPTTTMPYEKLFRWISRNTALKAEIERVETSDEFSAQLNTLRAAIRAGDLEDRIFEDRNCDVFLLILFKNNEISPSTFYTAYSYLMALMEVEFSAEYPGITKVTASLTVERLYSQETKRLTDFGVQYVHGACHKMFDLYPNHLKKEATMSGAVFFEQFKASFAEFISTLTPIEQCVVNLYFVDGDTHKNEEDVMAFYYQLGAKNPIYNSNKYHQKTLYGRKDTIEGIAELLEEDDDLLLHFPSYSIQHFFKTTICFRPLVLEPAFGRIGEARLLEMHRASEHPYPLYSRHVKHSMLTAHTVSGIPFAIAKHDETHDSLSAFYSKPQRNCLLNDYIGFIEDLEELVTSLGGLAGHLGKSPFAKIIDEINELKADPDLTFAKQLPTANKLEFSRLVVAKADDRLRRTILIALLMLKNKYSTDTCYAKKLICLQQMTGMLTGFKDYNNIKFTAFEKIAAAVAAGNDKDVAIDMNLNRDHLKIWDRFITDWGDKIVEDQKAFWTGLTINCLAESFYDLINKDKLMLFPPLIPFTAKTKEMISTAIEAKLATTPAYKR